MGARALLDATGNDTGAQAGMPRVLEHTARSDPVGVDTTRSFIGIYTRLNDAREEVGPQMLPQGLFEMQALCRALGRLPH